MAKKIILAFNSALETGIDSNFSYQIQIDGIFLTYPSGYNIVNIGFNTTADVIPTEIKKYSSLNDTVSKVLEFLNLYYPSPIITYTKIEDIIEVYIDSETANVYGLYTANTGVVVSVETVNVIVEGAIKLKYFFEYKNIANDDYIFEIYEVGYTGNSTEIYGRASIQKAGIKDHLDPVRGTSVNITLEASTDLTLDDLYTQDELNFPVKLYKNGLLIFRGFLNPDGVYQSFVLDKWVINLSCVDGLGAIDNLSFVNDSGFHFVGKMSMQDIVFNCLRRTGMLQNINTSVNIFYDDYEDLDNRNIFESVHLNTDRFVKKDDNTIMSCGDVLRSVLSLFKAVITQEFGEWWIYRPTEIYSSGYAEIKKYDISNNFVQKLNKNLNRKLGSQINNYYPYHCSADQNIQIKGAASAIRINYKYGNVGSLFSNPNLNHDRFLNYPFWTINPTDAHFLINDPLDLSGLKVNLPTNPQPASGILATSETLSFDAGDLITFSASYNATFNIAFSFYVRLGIYYLKEDGSWTTSVYQINLYIATSNPPTGAVSYGKWAVNSAPAPVSGDLFIEVKTPRKGVYPTVAEIESVSVSKNLNDNVVGEFHTAQRKSGVSSNVKVNEEVSNGDNISIQFSGAIYKINQIDITSLWHRKNFVESKPLLRISAEESLRVSQKPAKKFKGSFFGHMPYISLQTINNIQGKFMPIEYNYDTYTNTGSQVLLELFGNELPDIDYKFTFDYGETVKPTITS